MTESRVRWVHALTIIIGAVVLQVSIFDRHQPFDLVRVDIPLILIVSIGFVATPSDAAILGFVTGLFLDTMQFGPFGFSALVYCLAAWLIVLARLRVLQAGASFRTVQGAAIVVLVTAATWGAGVVFGLRAMPFGWSTLGRMALVGLVGAVLVHPLTRTAAWMVDNNDRSPLPNAGVRA